MSPDEAPAGTVVIVGHPANGVTATKQPNGRWLNNITRRSVDGEDIGRGSRAVYIPEVRP